MTSATTEPTDRSIPPETITKVMPIAPSADDDRLRRDGLEVVEGEESLGSDDAEQADDKARDP